MKFFKLTSLKSQLLLILGGSLLLCSLSLVVFNYWSAKNQVKERFTNHELPALTDRIHKDLKIKVNEAEVMTKAFAYNPFVIDWITNGEQGTEKILQLMQSTVKQSNIDIIGLAVSESLHQYYPEGLDHTLDPESPLDNWYFSFKAHHKNSFSSLDSLPGNRLYLFTDEKIYDSLHTFIGAVGFGIEMTDMGKHMASLKIGEKGSNYLIDSEGKKQIYDQTGNGKRNIREVEGLAAKASVIFTQKNGTFSYEKNGETYWVGFRHFPEQDWYLIIEASEEELLSGLRVHNQMLIGGSLLILLVICVISYFQMDRIVKPIEMISKIVERVTNGTSAEEVQVKTPVKELSRLRNAFNELIRMINRTTGFSQEIAKGNLNADFEALGENDRLGHSLLNMRSELTKVDQENKQRNWSTQGLAEFGDMLRNTHLDMNELGERLISKLVRYVDANQAAFFLFSDEDKTVLELKACYAYDRKKYLHKTIEVGEGLVGQAILEKDKIYMTDVPQDYVNITSGLGKAVPSCVLVMPLISNEEVVGAIELASFHPFKEFQLEFIEKLAEAIASTTSVMLINEKTRKLLQDSKDNAQALASQEEELRQNMEEMQATQEEMHRKEREYLQQIEKLEAQLNNTEA